MAFFTLFSGTSRTAFSSAGLTRPPKSTGCVFLKGVILRRCDRGWAVTRSVCTFLNMPGITEGDRRCSAVAAAGCRGQVRGGVRLAVPPVSGPVPGSWREMTLGSWRTGDGAGGFGDGDDDRRGREPVPGGR